VGAYSILINVDGALLSLVQGFIYPDFTSSGQSGLTASEVWDYLLSDSNTAAHDLVTVLSAVGSLPTSVPSATEIWAQIINSNVTGSAGATLLSVLNYVTATKTSTDTIDWSMIKKLLIMSIGNHTGLVLGAGNPTITLSGLGTAHFTVDANGNRTLTSISLS
jgi:hypothetical protein